MQRSKSSANRPTGSQHWTLDGVLQYQSAAAFDEVAMRLSRERQVDNDGYFLGEDASRLSTSDQPDLNAHAGELNVPLGVYRMFPVLEVLRSHPRGVLVGTCADRAFCGFVYENGVRRDYDLADWAAQHMPRGERKPPAGPGSPGYMNWESDVCAVFRAEMLVTQSPEDSE